MDSPIRTVSAFTVRSLPVLSFAKKNKAENKLPTITIKVKTIMTFTNIMLSKICFERSL